MTMLYTGNTIGFMFNGKFLQADKSNPNFNDVVALAKSGNFEAAADKINLRTAVAIATAGSKMELRGNALYFGTEVIRGVLGQRIIEMMRMGFNVKPLELFIENLLQNPSKRAVDELYGFLEASQLPITDDGHFLAYKSVRSDFTDHHSGKMNNSVGTIVSMERNKVDEDKDRTCSYGLHFAAHEYAESFGRSGKMVILKINPRDVVAIPSDYKNQKGRCCAYEVIDAVDRSDSTLVGSTIVGKPAPKAPTPILSEPFPVGTQVKLSEQGVDKWSGSGDSSNTSNPANTVGVVAPANSALRSFIYRVDWDNTTSNSYERGDLVVLEAPATPATPAAPLMLAKRGPISVGDKVVMSAQGLRDWTNGRAGANPEDTVGVVTSTTADLHKFLVKWPNGHNSYKTGDLSHAKVAQVTPVTSEYVPVADNYDDRDLWVREASFLDWYTFNGEAKEFPINRETEYDLERKSDSADYEGYYFIAYQPKHDNLVFRKPTKSGNDFNYVTISDVNDWNIGVMDSDIVLGS